MTPKTIKRGSYGADVATWQMILNAGAKPTTWVASDGVTRSWPSTWAWPIAVDGDFGQRTEWATQAWQYEHALVADGIVGPKTWAAAGAAGVASATSAPSGDLGFEFIPTRQYTSASRTTIDLVVIHTAECAEVRSAAENVATWGARPAADGGPKGASWHYMVDADSVTQSVREKDIAWHAGPVNAFSIGIEHAGYHTQTAAQWADPYSRAMLERSAQIVGDICRRYLIPVQRLTAEDLRAGQKKGITGHVDVTMGLSGGKGHVDPGPHFPWDWYLARVRFHARPLRELVVGGVRWLVAPTYIAPVSIGEAQRIAAARGCELPTPELVDAIWRAADLRVEPQPMAPNKGDDVAQFAAHAELVERAVGDRPFRLLAGTHKDVVRSGGRVGLYGWHRADARPIQGFFAGHALAYRDYSQGLRLVRRLT